jgi:hypothetical protein
MLDKVLERNHGKRNDEMKAGGGWELCSLGSQDATSRQYFSGACFGFPGLPGDAKLGGWLRPQI